MSANLSIIREDAQVIVAKEIGNTSGDSGIASANSSADVSVNSDSHNVPPGSLIKGKSNIMILFQALNEGRKESTFVASNDSKPKCNISAIDGNEQNKLTIDSDGKYCQAQGSGRIHPLA